MEWKSNAKLNQPLEEGSIFTLKSAPVQVHRIHGLDGTWFLTCHDLGISSVNLNTDNFRDAVASAQAMIRRAIDNLIKTYDPFTEDATEPIIVRY